MNNQDPRHEAFLDELAPIVDGDAAAIDRHADYLADSDDARDLRHDASGTARDVSAAGDDYVPPMDMADRVLAAVDAREASGAPDTLPMSGAPLVQRSYSEGGTPSTNGVVQMPAVSAEAIAPTRAASPSPAQIPMTQAPQTLESAPTKSKSRAGLFLVLGTGAVLAAAAAAAIGLMPSDPSATTPEEVASTGMQLTGTLATVVRASDEVEAAGVSIGSGADSRHIVQGATIAAGSVIRTDARTRAEVALSDGSTIVVDRASEVVVGGQGRSIELRSGQLVAEVAHLEDGPNATYETPSGVVEVLGTKFLLSASDGQAAVRVTRGAVRVRSQGQSVEVKTGQEGLMRRDSPPAVVPAMNLATSVAWSELDVEDDDLPVPGLGELRAHEPGEREESERELSLAHHGVSVRIVGNVARTEIAETFRNDTDDVLEGVYSFPMPADARIASLSLKVDGEWQEGAFVSKERAQRIWRGVIRNAAPERARPQEEFIWVPGPWRDPALLEWQQGGRFQLKIFPIPAHGEREIRLSYEQTIAPHGEGRRYVYPLPLAADDSTRVGHFEVDVRVAGAAQAKSRGYEMVETADDSSQSLRYSAQNFSPSGDLIIDYNMPNGDSEMRFWTFRGDATAQPPESTREDAAVLEQQRALDNDERGYALFALRPELPGWTEASARDYVFVVDASQSMVGERYERAIRLAEGVIGEMDRRDRVYALACDVECRGMEGGPALPNSATAAAVREFLEKEEPAGASDIGASMRAATRLASDVGAGRERELHFVYIGDGVASVGHRRPGSLAAEVELALGEEDAQLTTVGIGQGADAISLGAMARAGAGHYVPYVPGQRTSAAALAVLETTYGASLEDAQIIMPEGIVSVVPAELPTIRSGQEVLISARVTRDGVSGDVVLRGSVGGREFEQRYPVSLALTESAGNAFVPRILGEQEHRGSRDQGTFGRRSSHRSPLEDLQRDVAGDLSSRARERCDVPGVWRGPRTADGAVDRR